MIQLVTARTGMDKLQRSLQSLPTDKVVFLTSKDDLKEVLQMRNDFAMQNGIPTEIKVLENDIRGICDALLPYRGAVLHVVDPSYLSSYIQSACFMLGIQTYVSYNGSPEEVPSPRVPYRDLLCENQIRLLECLRDPHTKEELRRECGWGPALLDFYLIGKNAVKGLVELGLVEKVDDTFRITELGRTVLNT